MPFVVVRNGQVQCSHGGVATLTAGNAKLRAGGQPVVVSGQEAGISFAATSVPCPHTSGMNPSPCTATLAAVAGVSLKLTVDGLGVLLDTANGNATNANDPAATWSVLSAGQNILEEN